MCDNAARIAASSAHARKGNKPGSSALHWATSQHPGADYFPINTTPRRVLFLMRRSNLGVRVERDLPFQTHLLSVFEKV